MAGPEAGDSVQFEATPRAVDGSVIMRLPAEASARLPSRGQVAVAGTLNGHPFRTVLEPDGERGHWIRVDPELQRAAGARPGAPSRLALEPSEQWPEPELPEDLEIALADAPDAIRRLWREITPMARWEWVRWINATRNPDTRSRRVAVSISKMGNGKRRPCCFDLSSCTDPRLSRSGRLVDGA